MPLFCLLFVASVATAAIRPADGLWNTTDDPEIGSGLMFSTQGDITLVSVFTYDEEGNNVWYIGSGQVDDNGVLEVELVTPTNGSYLAQDDPATATVDENSHQLHVEFNGSQWAEFSLNGSDLKSIRANHFGFETMIQFPDVSGKWIMGNPTNNNSYILDLELEFEAALGSTRQFLYRSSHASTENWTFNCSLNIAYPDNNKCSISRDDIGQLPELLIDVHSLGNQGFEAYQDYSEPFEMYQAFRLNNDRRFLPADGYWRTHDDPEIGSGLVMRTQGDYTVVLIYSYNDEGQATWQIASGQFDENGFMEAELYTPSGGSPVNSVDVTTGQVAEPRNIAIQLQGTNLGTVSIDARPEKSIQAFVYGLEMFETHHKTIDDGPFLFPDQQGKWVIVNGSYTDSGILTLDPFDLNDMQSPPDPRLINARQYTNTGNNHSANASLFCIKILRAGDYVIDLTPYCYGFHSLGQVTGSVKMYYEDIGTSEFRYYTSEVVNGYDVSHINRDSTMFFLFKLSTD